MIVQSVASLFPDRTPSTIDLVVAGLLLVGTSAGLIGGGTRWSLVVLVGAVISVAIGVVAGIERRIGTVEDASRISLPVRVVLVVLLVIGAASLGWLTPWGDTHGSSIAAGIFLGGGVYWLAWLVIDRAALDATD